EAVIVLLSVVGFIAAITKKGISFANADLLRFIAFYTLAMTAIYSAIPYKTPWCMLGFLHGMILLAGVGAVVLVKASAKRPAAIDYSSAAVRYLRPPVLAGTPEQL
ncbi:unnamed protein product, partial [marine sediment metagenome]